MRRFTGAAVGVGVGCGVAVGAEEVQAEAAQSTENMAMIAKRL